MDWFGNVCDERGHFMTDFEAGIVTDFDIHQMLPHPLNAIALTMSGEELEILIDGIYRKKAELQDIPLRGFGFRGEYFGTVLMDRASFDSENQVALLIINRLIKHGNTGLRRMIRLYSRHFSR